MRRYNGRDRAARWYEHSPSMGRGVRPVHGRSVAQSQHEAGGSLVAELFLGDDGIFSPVLHRRDRGIDILAKARFDLFAKHPEEPREAPAVSSRHGSL
jgi:hypothetical protein